MKRIASLASFFACLAGAASAQELKIDFAVESRGDSATVACGDVLVAESYALQWRSEFVATVQTNPAMVFTFKSDKTIVGPATAAVSGRVLTGMNGAQVLYAPKTATCAFDSLRHVNQR